MTALALAIGFPGTAAATVYKWVDENGMAHYTTDPDQVPGRLRIQRPTREAVRSVDSPPEIRENELYSIPAPRPLPDETPVPEGDPIGIVAPLEAPPGTPPIPSAPASTPTPAATSASEVLQARPRDPPPLIESSGDPPEDPRIGELEAEIDRERDVLKELLSGSGADGDRLRNPELRGVAERLSRLQHELNAVRTHEGL